jgi:periplasmic divalent cation tolerance protein
MEKFALIISNFASPEAARSVLRILMQENIIMCGNIFAPHFSIYTWKDKVEEQSEVAVMFKGAWENREHIIKRLRELHPYELPGILLLDAETLPDYAAWLKG